MKFHDQLNSHFSSNKIHVFLEKPSDENMIKKQDLTYTHRHVMKKINIHLS